MNLSKIRLLLLSAGIIAINNNPIYASGAVNHAEIVDERASLISVPDGFKVERFADHSLTQNPSFFTFDAEGRMLIAEVNRINFGVDDVRRYNLDMTIQDLYIESSEDRLRMYRENASKLKLENYTSKSDTIRKLEDLDNDGVADKSTLYADGFNNILDGLGVGLIERDGSVYYTNIPNLWRLKDNDLDGKVDEKEVIQDGFGIRVSFMGHDMHGLAWGPDGRLYWSIGDRGYSFVNKEGEKKHGPFDGAVFRSNADGSNLEVFYTGLRNPQELVFDEYGNLFTADNDGDQSDTERVNHLIEGGDSGWHAGHQSLMSFAQKFNLRSFKYIGDTQIPLVWLVNDLSKPRSDKQPAFLLPGIGKLETGPSGFAYNPAGYFGEEWKNTFFVAHFAGTPTSTYISSFKNEENGASFLMKEHQRFLTGANVTDMEFGPDGRLYVAEFNFGGWGAEEQGAIYAVSKKNQSTESKLYADTFRAILTSKFSGKSTRELTQLIKNEHQTVRQKAQFELAKRPKESASIFWEIAEDAKENRFARIHSVWGLSQLVLQGDIPASRLTRLLGLLSDKDKHIRTQVIRVLGDHGANYRNIPEVESAFIKGLNDRYPQVQMYAALGLNKLNKASSVGALIKHVKKVKDRDLWVRHALVMALKGIDKQHWVSYKNSKSKHVRMATLLALRILNDPEVADFLNDRDPAIVREAIYAIEDKRIVTKQKEVAEKLSSPPKIDSEVDAYIHHMIINANYNLGGAEEAERLLRYASQKGLSDRLAAEALAAIEAWNDINPVDNITGLPSTANKDRADIAKLVKRYIPKILSNTKGYALIQSMRIAQAYEYELSESQLIELASDKESNSDMRIQAIDLLKGLNEGEAGQIAQKMLEDDDVVVVRHGLSLIFERDPEQGVAKALSLLSGNVQQKKAALTLLTNVKSKKPDVQVSSLMDKLLNETLDKRLMLELIELAEKSENSEIQQQLKEYQEKLKTADILTQFESAQFGGNAKVGKAAFHGGGAAQCIRCHKVNNTGSSWVGPDLTGLAGRYKADYLLQALVDPGAAVAPMHGMFTLKLKSGDTVSGNFIEETDESITLFARNGQKIPYLKENIIDIKRPVSGMPPMQYLISKREIRDILAYLMTLTKGQSASSAH